MLETRDFNAKRAMFIINVIIMMKGNIFLIGRWMMPWKSEATLRHLCNKIRKLFSH